RSHDDAPRPRAQRASASWRSEPASLSLASSRPRPSSSEARGSYARDKSRALDSSDMERLSAATWVVSRSIDTGNIPRLHCSSFGPDAMLGDDTHHRKVGKLSQRSDAES